MEPAASRFVDQRFRLIDIDHVVEERELHVVNAHRALFRTADASPILNVAFSDRGVEVAKAFGGLSNGFRHRTVETAILMPNVLTTFGSDDG